MRNADFHVAVLPGDGIGAEVMAPCLDLLEKAAARIGGIGFRFETLAGGAGHWRETGQSMPRRTRETCARADAILLAAMGLPDIRYPDGREIAPQIELRMEFGLYAGVRPVRPIPGVRPVLSDPRARDMDFVIVRESTEGLFAPQAPGEIRDDREARETLVLTRATCEKLYDFCFRLAGERRRPGAKVTHVDKANVFPAFHWARGIFRERARAFPEIAADAAYVDAFAMTMVQRPWTIDVAVTENMFGDILSDLGAALMGGMGYAPSADIGDGHAVFQPCHGTAPDIAGRGLANPTAMVLSGAMMLEWLGARHEAAEPVRAGALIRRAVDAAFADGRLVTCELGGEAGTAEVHAAVAAAMDRVEP
ncbi:MAG TPA: isocitrate/isopropylmalate family dehydrogenase [Paracoccaceae bacterium]|nr:isocitrate/isopropylmalate family dehydrogenase [Paracoccaceae bacterium]